jgi:hypothetical protein
MFQINAPFPRNVLAALDALVELGKAVQIKKQSRESIPARLQFEIAPRHKNHSIHTAKNQKKRDKA